MTRPSMHELLRQSPVRLAPMASFTNAPFRAIAVRCGSGFTTNEEIDADALLGGNARTEESTRGEDGSGLVAMQLLGSSAETLVPAALLLVEAGADIIDINMGCPVPKIVRKGKGAVLMRDVPATARILAALRRALDDVPLTIKIRGGWDEHQPNAVEVARMAQDVGVDAIAVHPRTRAQRLGGRAPWDVIADVVAAVEIPVTGNGDVGSLAEARRMMETTGCDSVMIGRAALGRPWLFDEAYGRLDGAARANYEAAAIAAHLDLIDDRFAPREALVQTKKHLARYAAGWSEARTLRGELFAQPNTAAARALFARWAESSRPDEARPTSAETQQQQQQQQQSA
ncbi:MAG: tRNA-dihydrouridine synthase family protein [Chloroflexi bacterium]|nr:tRNA-dihydrouridine synthase family protein [Chloroflexota bacterium]